MPGNLPLALMQLHAAHIPAGPLSSQVCKLQCLWRPGALVCEDIAGCEQQALSVTQAGRRHNAAGRHGGSVGTS